MGGGIMLRPRRVSVKGAAIFSLSIAIVIFVLAIVLFSTGNTTGGGICLAGCCFFIVPAIICFIRYKKTKLAIRKNANREKALTEITDALIGDLGIDCPDAIRERVIKDVSQFVYYLSEKEIKQQRSNPILFNTIASSAPFCCVNSPDSLLILIHSILIYHYLSLPQRIEEIRVSNNILPVNWAIVKKQVFHIIEEHLTNHKDEPIDIGSEEFTEKMKNALNTSTYVYTRGIKINRKEPKKEERGT